MKYLIKGRIQSTLHIWFENEKHTANNTVDIIKYYGIDTTWPGAKHIKSQNTLITNLDDPQEKIFSNFASNTRNEIRRAEREGVYADNYDSNHLKHHHNILDNFIKMYCQMYLEKNLKVKISKTTLLAIIEKNGLFITQSSYEEQILAYHVYIIDKTHARLLYSCSNFRIANQNTQKIIGRANRFLHWQDMLLLKGMGIKTYDWGGISSFDNPNGIDKFKLSFNGEQKIYYNITEHISAKSKILARIKDPKNE